MKHLTEEQRYTISVLYKQGITQKEIANIIGKDKSTISRELQRNSDKRSGEYRFELATKKCRERHRLKRKSIRLTKEIQSYIEKLLKKYYSPEQIYGRAKKEGLDIVSIETIYQYIWKNKHLNGSLYTRLRRHGKRYKKRGSLKDHRGQIPNRVDISLRPTVVEEKSRIGDLEVDTIIGANHQGALLTLVDRRTKMTKIALLKFKEAKLVEDCLNEMLSHWTFTKTITSDNGKEFANHLAIAIKNKIGFYFAQPFKSWQRGLNENTNGLIRQFIPKKMSFIYLTDKYITFIEDNLNNRPRKTLDYKTPNEVFLHEMNREVAFIT